MWQKRDQIIIYMLYQLSSRPIAKDLIQPYPDAPRNFPYIGIVARDKCPRARRYMYERFAIIVLKEVDSMKIMPWLKRS